MERYLGVYLLVVLVSHNAITVIAVGCSSFLREQPQGGFLTQFDFHVRMPENCPQTTVADEESDRPPGVD